MKKSEKSIWERLRGYLIWLPTLWGLIFLWGWALKHSDNPLAALIAGTTSILAAFIFGLSLLLKHLMQIRNAILDIQSSVKDTSESLNVLGGLIVDLVNLQRQGMENQQQINELIIERIDLHFEEQQLRAALKQQTPTPSDSERGERNGI